MFLVPGSWFLVPGSWLRSAWSAPMWVRGEGYGCGLKVACLPVAACH